MIKECPFRKRIITETREVTEDDWAKIIDQMDLLGEILNDTATTTVEDIFSLWEFVEP